MPLFFKADFVSGEGVGCYVLEDINDRVVSVTSHDIDDPI